MASAVRSNGLARFPQIGVNALNGRGGNRCRNYHLLRGRLRISESSWIWSEKAGNYIFFKVLKINSAEFF